MGLTRTAQVLLVLALALPAPARAFRTAADTPGFAPGVPVRWAGPIHWRVDPAGVDGVSAAELGRIVEAALSDWSDVACTDLTFIRDPDGSTTAPDGVVTIRPLGAEWAARGYPFDVPARTEVVYADGPMGWSIVDADVYLNDAGFDLVATEPGTLLSAVLRHEGGHVLGLLHCCGRLEGAPVCGEDPICSEATMSPLYDPVLHARVGPDDQLGACWLYPRDSCTGVSCVVGEVCRGGTCIPAPATCADDRGCAAGMRCVSGECLLGHGRLGDPCALSPECVTMLCGDRGYCTSPCSPGSACPADFECSGGECVSVLGVVGDPCTSSSDCLEGQCLDGARSTPICTRTCGAPADCPRGWSCVLVDGRDVCRPPGGGGCAASRRPALSPLGCLLACALAAWARRRMRNES